MYRSQNNQPKKHIEIVEEAYFEDTGILAYFYLVTDYVDQDQRVLYELLYSNVDCDIAECNLVKDFIETYNFNSDGDSLFPYLGLSQTSVFFMSVFTLIVIVIYLKRRNFL